MTLFFHVLKEMGLMKWTLINTHWGIPDRRSVNFFVSSSMVLFQNIVIIQFAMYVGIACHELQKLSHLLLYRYTEL